MNNTQYTQVSDDWLFLIYHNYNSRKKLTPTLHKKMEDTFLPDIPKRVEIIKAWLNANHLPDDLSTTDNANKIQVFLLENMEFSPLEEQDTIHFKTDTLKKMYDNDLTLKFPLIRPTREWSSIVIDLVLLLGETLRERNPSYYWRINNVYPSVGYTTLQLVSNDNLITGGINVSWGIIRQYIRSLSLFNAGITDAAPENPFIYYLLDPPETADPSTFLETIRISNEYYRNLMPIPVTTKTPIINSMLLTFCNPYRARNAITPEFSEELIALIQPKLAIEENKEWLTKNGLDDIQANSLESKEFINKIKQMMPTPKPFGGEIFNTAIKTKELKVTNHYLVVYNLPLESETLLIRLGILIGSLLIQEKSELEWGFMRDKKHSDRINPFLVLKNRNTGEIEKDIFADIFKQVANKKDYPTYIY